MENSQCWWPLGCACRSLSCRPLANSRMMLSRPKNNRGKRRVHHHREHLSKVVLAPRPKLKLAHNTNASKRDEDQDEYEHGGPYGTF